MKTLKKLISALFWLWLISLSFGVGLLLFYFLAESLGGVKIAGNIMVMGLIYYTIAIYLLYPAGIIFNGFILYKYFKTKKEERISLKWKLISYSILFLLNLPAAFGCFYIYATFSKF